MTLISGLLALGVAGRHISSHDRWVWLHGALMKMLQTWPCPHYETVLRGRACNLDSIGKMRPPRSITAVSYCAETLRRGYPGRKVRMRKPHGDVAPCPKLIAQNSVTATGYLHTSLCCTAAAPAHLGSSRVHTIVNTNAVLTAGCCPAAQSVKDMPIVQDGPPPGGFPSVRYARRLPSTGPTGPTLFLVSGAIMAYGFYLVSTRSKCCGGSRLSHGRVNFHAQCTSHHAVL